MLAAVVDQSLPKKKVS